MSESEKVFLKTCMGKKCPEENKISPKKDDPKKELSVYGCSQETTAGTLNKTCSECKDKKSPKCLKHNPATEISHGYCPKCLQKEMEKFKPKK